MSGPARITVATVAPAATSDELWPGLESSLSREERARAALFRCDRDRGQFIIAHALKRFMLRGASGKTDWTFEAGPFGKPAIAGDRGPHFNLSHCKGLVACAVSPDVPLGIDVEPLDRLVPSGLAEVSLAPGEHAWLLDLLPQERQRGFLRLWTLKEAFIKATGKGMSQDLQSFAIALDPIAIAFQNLPSEQVGNWGFAQRIIAEHHVLGLCWAASESDVSYQDMRPDELAAS